MGHHAGTWDISVTCSHNSSTRGRQEPEVNVFRFKILLALSFICLLSIIVYLLQTEVIHLQFVQNYGGSSVPDWAMVISGCFPGRAMATLWMLPWSGYGDSVDASLAGLW